MCLVGKCHPNRSSEDIPAFWRLTATIASCLSRTWPAGALVTHCYTLTFTGEFVKLAVGSIPVCVFDKSIGLLVNIPFCSWRKQPNPWRHPGTPLPEILGGLALVRLGFTPKMLGNQSHSPSVNVMAWYGTIRIHTKLTSKFLVSSTILLAYEPQSKFIVCVKSVIKLVSPLSFYRLSCFYIFWQVFTSV